jgi:hypothetical protein
MERAGLWLHGGNALPPAGPTDRPIEDCVLSSPSGTTPTPALQSAPARPSAPSPTATGDPDLVVEIQGVRRTVLQALRLFGETVVVPTLLVTVLLPFTNLFVALGAALGWCYLAVLFRWVRGHQMPGTMMLCVSMLSGKACLALATGSAFVYLLQPALGSGLMALLFLGSALLGRPVTMRLARDFVHLPHHVLARGPVRAMFIQVALLWGAGRLPALERRCRPALPRHPQPVADRAHGRGLHAVGLAGHAPGGRHLPVHPRARRHALGLSRRSSASGTVTAWSSTVPWCW